MARTSEIRIHKQKNNNYHRKRLKVKNSKKDLINFKFNKLKKSDFRFKSIIFAITFISILIMASLTINTRKQLLNAKSNYNNLDSQYISYQLTRDRIKTSLEKSIDIEEIQRYAREELGMVYANDSNTVYVNVNR